MKHRKVTKCPQCLPDAAGAVFKTEYVDDGKWQWVCQNCWYKCPVRHVKRTGKPTKSQQRVLDKLVELGWTITKQELVGRKVWVEAKAADPNRSWFYGDSTYGTIGATGKFSLACTAVGSNKKCVDFIDLKVYLDARPKTQTEAF